MRDEIAALAAEPGRRCAIRLDYGAPSDGEEMQCDTFAGRRLAVDARGRLSLCCQLSEYGFNDADVVADLAREPFAQAWPRYVEGIERLRVASRPRTDGGPF